MNFRLFKRETAEERRRRLLNAALQHLAAAPPEQRFAALAGLFRTLRPRRATDSASAERELQSLTALISTEEPLRRALSEALLQLLTEKQWVHLLSDSGVLGAEGLLSGLWRRLGQKLLPEVFDRNNLRDLLGQLFDRKDDHVWVQAVGDAAWAALFDALNLDTAAAIETRQRILLQTLEALQVLAYRLAAIGLDPELVRNHAAIERYESPFLAQVEEVRQFIRERQQALVEKRAPQMDDKHLQVLLEQCGEVISKIRRQSEKTGASIGLTTLLRRSEQIIARIQTLLRLLEPRPAHEINLERIALFKRLVRAENHRLSLRKYWSQHLELLATRITTNAGKTGEHYVTATRREYYMMLRSALGAGFIVAFMALFKLALSAEPHAPVVAAMLYSLNYGLGFVLIYLMGFTIATKQPAMTASHIAHTMDEPGEGRGRLDGLAELIVQVFRSQFIAIVGNVTFALSVPVLLGYLWLTQTGQHYVTPDLAANLLREHHPLQSLALFHAAIAGVCLFLAGLVSGYYDNKCVYDRIPQRIRQLGWLKSVAGERGREHLAGYIEAHLGGIAGNFFFGVMLGSMGTLGFILGLPLDIRHVTFSSAYFSYALVALDWQIGLTTAAWIALGIAGIGLANLLVSFGLALYVAMKAQRVEFADGRQLLARLGRRLLTTPRDFFLPPRRDEPAELNPAKPG